MENAPALELDSDFEFLSPLANSAPSKIAREHRANKLTPKEKTFYARLGAAALTAMILSTSMAAKSHLPQKPAIETEALGDGVESNLPPIVIFKPTVERIKTSPAMTATDSAENIDLSFIPDIPVSPEELELVTTPEITPEAEEIYTENMSFIKEPTDPSEQEVLNAQNGHIDGPTGDETFYNLPMDEIVARMHRMGVEGDYWVREDGVKMLGNYVMVAANLKTHPRGSIVETSLGTGIVCDTGGFAKEHPKRLDIATNW